jgi:hypothetical protein
LIPDWLRRGLMSPKIVAVICALSAHFLFFVHLSVPFWNDWYYFNSLSLVVRSAVLQFGQLPIHNPWVCGGLDLLTNPQNRLFSPFFLFDLALPPQWSNLLSLVVLAGLGFIGCHRLLRQFSVSSRASLVGAWLFVHGSWFALHYAEGHIPFGGMLLIPLAMSFGMQIQQPRSFLGLVLLMAWMLLDGAIYAVIYTGFAIGTLLVMGRIPVRQWLHAIRMQPLSYFMAVLAAVLLAVPKVLPVLASISNRSPHLDFYEMPARLLVHSLFYPWVDLTMGASRFVEGAPSSPWRMHEFGCYLSWVGTLLVLGGLFGSRQDRRSTWILYAAFLFWLWVGSGWIPSINPWRLFQAIPLVNNAHVQSRVFLIMFVFFIIMLAKALERLEGRRRYFAWLVAFLVLESVVIRNRPMRDPPPHYEPTPGWQLIQRSTIDRTVAGLHWMPGFYLGAENLGSKACYEPSWQPVNIQADSDPGYRGEIYPADAQNGSARLLSVIPGRIEFEFELTQPGRIMLNSNALYGWVVRSANAQVFGRAEELLSMQPDELKGTIVLAYRPWYLKWIWFSYGFGIIIALFCWIRIKRQGGKIV